MSIGKIIARHGRIAAFALAVLLSSGAVAQPVTEYQVKAAFLYNFTRYIEWPASAFDASGSFRICIAGRNPFGTTLSEAVSGESVAGHRIQVVSIVDDPTMCHVLFIAKTAAERAPSLVRRIHDNTVAVVGEQDRFLEQGGMINFVLEEGHVRFEINPLSKTATALTVSSKLLRIARITATSGRP